MKTVRLLEENMKTSDFYYDLPQELIAQDPLEDRSASRLMVLDKKTGKIQHHIFKEIVNYLNPGDCLVINDTKVIPARLYGAKEGTGRQDRDSSSETEREQCLGDAGKTGKKGKDRARRSLSVTVF